MDEKTEVEDVCPLYKFCFSPSKSDEWACLKSGEVRMKSCAIYVAFMRGNDKLIKCLAWR